MEYRSRDELPKGITIGGPGISISLDSDLWGMDDWSTALTAIKHLAQQQKDVRDMHLNRNNRTAAKMAKDEFLFSCLRPTLELGLMNMSSNPFANNEDKFFAAEVIRIRSILPKHLKEHPRAAIGDQRTRIIARDHCSCRYCGRSLEIGQVNIDHIIPFIEGGTTTDDNLITSCIPCNSRKRNKTPEEAGMRFLPIPE